MLLDHNYPTGAIYLAGYGVECMLKALILTATPAAKEADVESTFRGNRGHDLIWLRNVYINAGGARPPKEILKDFDVVDGWATDLRYSPIVAEAAEAKRFLAAVGRLLQWASGRLT